MYASKVFQSIRFSTSRLSTAVCSALTGRRVCMMGWTVGKPKLSHGRVVNAAVKPGSSFLTIRDLFTKNDFTLDFVHATVTCPHGETVPMIPGKTAQFPASACDACPVRAQCTKARLGQGRSLHIRADEQFQHKLRAKIKT